MATKRLEYIDALRGFTMILVVFAHIINYGYHITDAKAETMDMWFHAFSPYISTTQLHFLFKEL